MGKGAFLLHQENYWKGSSLPREHTRSKKPRKVLVPTCSHEGALSDKTDVKKAGEKHEAEVLVSLITEMQGESRLKPIPISRLLLSKST